MEPAIAVNKLLADLANRGADPGWSGYEVVDG